MKKIGGNDAMEMWAVSSSEPRPGGIINHERKVMDSRARWMMQMVQHWGAATFLGDAMQDLHQNAPIEGTAAVKPPAAPGKRPAKQEVVMIAAELVEAAWDEATHRGWIVEVPSFVEGQ